MRDELLKYFGPQEVRLTLMGDELVVKTLPDDTDVDGFRAAGEDVMWRFVTRCTFDVDGKPVFTDADIPTLKAAPRVRTLPLVQAVQDVNGFNLFGEVKNSAAVPSGG